MDTNITSSFDIVPEYEKEYEKRRQQNAKRRPFQWKRFFMTLALILALILIALLVLYSFTDGRQFAGQTASTTMSSVQGNGEYYVVAVGKNNRLSLRSAPNDDAEKLDRINNGTRLLITEIQGNWGKTTYNGKTGWVCIHNSEDGDVYLQKE